MRIDKHTLKLTRYFYSLNLSKFDMQDFYAVCPYTEKEIRCSSRKNDLTEWRQVAGIWAYFQEGTVFEAGLIVNRTHSTITNSFKKVLLAVEGFDKALKSKLEIVINEARKAEFMERELVRKSPDHHQNELIALTLLDSKFNELRS